MGIHRLVRLILRGLSMRLIVVALCLLFATSASEAKPRKSQSSKRERTKRLRDVERSITEEKVFAFLLSQSTVEQP